MAVVEFALFLASLLVLVKGAEYAVRYSSRIARAFRISEFVVSFFVVSFISCSPEATVSIISAINGVPEFGLGALLGSNVADLALVFGIVALFSANGVKVKSQILRNDLFYLVLLLVPIILGFDGHLSREDGLVLVLSGVAFLGTLAMQSHLFRKRYNNAKSHEWAGNFLLLVLSLAFLVAGAYFTVRFGVDFANSVQIPPFLVALTMVSIGSCMPEMIFSLKAVRAGHDSLALGDVLGTVIIDATMLVGVLALISPFDFNPNIVRVTGVMMFFAGVLAVMFIKSGKVLTRKEGLLLLLFYLLSLAVEFWVNGAI
jgi:cation:H+ antiporter